MDTVVKIFWIQKVWSQLWSSPFRTRADIFLCECASTKLLTLVIFKHHTHSAELWVGRKFGGYNFLQCTSLLPSGITQNLATQTSSTSTPWRQFVRRHPAYRMAAIDLCPPSIQSDPRMVTYEEGAHRKNCTCIRPIVHSTSDLLLLPLCTEYVFYPKHIAQDKYKDVHIRHGLLYYKVHSS